MITRQARIILNSITVVIFFTISLAVADERVTVSGSAVAERHADGTITSRKPTSSEIIALEVSRNNLKEIDCKYPGPEIPKNAKLFQVISIDNKGTITLENGQRIRLEGMKCSPETPDYLRRLLMGDMDRVVYILSSSQKDDPAAAYIWYASLSLMNDPEMKEFITGPSYSVLNEAALTSGWCTPERSSSNAYNDRYEALSKIAPNR